MNILNQFTLRTLRKNRTRTWVTIVGILLSTAMFTAVTSIVVSFQQYMVDVEINSSGSWEGEMNNLPAESLKELETDKDITGYTAVSDIGYAMLEHSQADTRPYLYLAGLQENYTKYRPVRITEGRMPSREGELIVPTNLLESGGADYKIGDTVSLQVGERVYADGENKGERVGGQQQPLITQEEYGATEKLANTQKRTYTIVGIYDSAGLDSFGAPGYFACTVAEDTACYDVWLTFRQPKKAEEIMERYVTGGMSTTVHSELLRYRGQSSNEAYTGVLTGMAAILMGIIMLGSISLIYNAFSISLSERTKQFGLLKSIGATKRQMKNSVLFEASVLSLIGIPAGIASGLVGIGITLHFVGRLFSQIVSSAGEAKLHLVISWQAVLIAAVVAYITVIVSALIPAVRAVRIPAVQAVRQNGDIRIRRREVRTSRLTYRLFGFEAMLASKNFKRNRKKYRATVLSLFVSIVLFVSANSFSRYMSSSTDVMALRGDYDILFRITADGRQDDAGTVAEEVRKLQDVQDIGYARTVYSSIKVPLDSVTEGYKKVVQTYSPSNISEEDGTITIECAVFFLDNATYDDWLRENEPGLLRQQEDAAGEQKQYLNGGGGKTLLWDSFVTYMDGKLFNYQAFREESSSLEVPFPQEMKGYTYSYESEGMYYYEAEKKGSTEEVEAFTAKDSCVVQTLETVRASSEMIPLGVEDLSSSGVGMITMVLPYDVLGQLENTAGASEVSYQIRTDNHRKASQELSALLTAMPGYESAASSIYDYGNAKDSDKVIIWVIDIFSYGFIVLISLISLANVFNTISTNIQLRRQEFAMLESVGMTPKGFRRMMNYECMLYGVKSLLYGIPVSLLLSWLMFTVVITGWNVPYQFPAESILISVVVVFGIVFATMLYAMRKIRTESTIEALRNENL